MVWDRLPARRSRMVLNHKFSLQGWIRLEYPPAYAPELNPVEHMWGDRRNRELPNLCPKTTDN